MPFSAEDAMAFMQKMWNPFAMPMPAATPEPRDADRSAPAAPAPRISRRVAVRAAAAGDDGQHDAGHAAVPEPGGDVRSTRSGGDRAQDRRVAVIESWLTMSLNMTQMSIKTLELQHASLEAMRATHAPAKPSR